MYFLNSGVIMAADNEAELAGVVSHEMAQVIACHAAQEFAREELMDIGSMWPILKLAIRPAILNAIYTKPASAMCPSSRTGFGRPNLFFC
jgi:predicted Zn-dependent protease